MPPVFKTTNFRIGLLFAFGLSAACLALSAFIYWQTAIVEAQRVNELLVRDAAVMATESSSDLKGSVERRVAADFHRMAYASLFDSGQRLIVGNLKEYPAGIPADGRAHRVFLDNDCCKGTGQQAVVHMVARRLADGDTLVIGRNVDSLADIEKVVLRALEMGGIPIVMMAALGGIVLGSRAQRHAAAIRDAAERVVRGELEHRLPTRGKGDEFDLLVESCNRMLDGVIEVVDQVKSSSDHIAHDLRTPLTRLRSRLERACETASGYEELRDMVEGATGGLDQALRMMNALLRIRRLDAGHYIGDFALADLASIARAAADLYQAVAEEKGIAFTLAVDEGVSALCDRDLILEAVTNLVDNAIKYTPAGGHVRLSVSRERQDPMIRVQDDGVGIAEGEKAAVLRRFYRGDRSHHVEGCGLGLALVDAVVRLHGFRLRVSDGSPGTIFELVCAPRSQPTPGSLG